MEKSEYIDNQLKSELFDDILSQANRISFWNLPTKGWPNYSFNSKIAAYSLYNSTYHMTDKAKILLEENQINFDDYHTRRKISNIRDSNRKKLTTYEHMIPCVVQRALIKKIVMEKGKITSTELHNILDNLDTVTIMTQEENRILEKRFKSSIPTGCNPLVNPEARYSTCGITLSNKVLKMKGSMVR
jgi:hypothetical protein